MENCECKKYVESIFFQRDLFPLTDVQMLWTNTRKGRLIKFTYFLDSSMGDSVEVLAEKCDKHFLKQNILHIPETNGQEMIKGTFNSTVLEFGVNLNLENQDKLQLTCVNGSASDVTIMAIFDIEYDEREGE
jgi:hypothetical protein